MAIERISFVGSLTAWNALPANEQTRYTSSGGAHFTDIITWEASFGNRADGDLVTANELAVAELAAEDFIGDFQFNGWTTDSTRYLVVRAAPGAEYDHVTDTGARVYKQGDYGLDAYNLTKFYSIRLGHPSYVYPFFTRADYSIEIYGSTIRSSNAVTGGYVGNSINASLVYLPTATTGDPIKDIGLNNVTIICNNSDGQVARSCACNNVVIYNAVATPTYGNFYACTGDYNASSDSSAPGANSIQNITSAEFADYAGGDYHLTSTSILKGAGVNLSSSISKDIDGDTWPTTGAWDIGADYYVSTGGTLVLIDRAIPCTYAATVATVVPNNIAYTHSLKKLKDLPIEVALDVVQNAVYNISNTSTTTKHISIPIEWQGSALINIDKITNIEWSESLHLLTTKSIESSLDINSTKQLLTEWSQALRIDSTNHIAWALDVQVGRLIPISWTSSNNFTATRLIPIDFSTTIDILSTLPVSTIENLITTNSLEVSWALDLATNKLVPVSSSLSMNFSNLIPVEWQGIIATPVSSTKQLPISWSTSIAIDKFSSIDWENSVVANNLQAVVDTLLDVSATSTYSVNNTQQVISEDIVEIQWSSTISLDETIPIEFKGYATVDVIANIETQASISTTIIDPIAWLQSVGIDTSFLIDWDGATVTFIVGNKLTWTIMRRNNSWTLQKLNSSWN